jgi:hypothetical protein
MESESKLRALKLITLDSYVVLYSNTQQGKKHMDPSGVVLIFPQSNQTDIPYCNLFQTSLKTRCIPF